MKTNDALQCPASANPTPKTAAVARLASFVSRRLLLITVACLAVAGGQNAQAKTIVVHSTADGGPGSLRDTLALASNGDTINITANGTITLTTGELVVNKSVTIRGPGPHGIVSGNGASRVFHITPGTAVTISGLTITNGNAIGNFPADAGGGIYTDHAKLTVSNCTLTGNSASYGGSVFNLSDDGVATPLTVNNSTLSNNSAVYGGGIYNAGGGTAIMTLTNSTLNNNSASFRGGGIYNDGENGGNAMVAVTNSVLRGNSARVGGGIYNDGEGGSATLALNNSTVSGNSGDLTGGIVNDGTVSGSATATLSSSTVSGNSGGGIFNGNATLTLSNSIVNNNSGDLGGGIYNVNAVLTLNHSAVSDNSASFGGGGVYNFGGATLTLNNTTVSGNSGASTGGGIWNDNATATLNNSTVSGNSADGGGGIENDNATVTLSNSTVSANVGGGIFNYGAGGGSATFTLNNSTVSGNTGGGIYNSGVDNGSGLLMLTNSTVSNNSLSGGGAGGIQNISINSGSATLEIANTIFKAGASGENIGSNGTVISHGYNLSSDAAGGDATTGPGGLLNGPGDIRNTDPLLGPLQDNGGPTLTHALLAHSPAIDRGDPNFNPYLFNPPLLYDQRGPGFPRIVNGRVDIGAFEFK